MPRKNGLCPAIGAREESRAGVAQSIERLSYHMPQGRDTLDPGLEPYQCLYSSIWVKWLSCHAGCQEIGRCHTRGDSEESVVCKGWSMQVRESTLALKPRVDVTRIPKQGYQWPHKKVLCPPKFKKSEKIRKHSSRMYTTHFCGWGRGVWWSPVL